MNNRFFYIIILFALLATPIYAQKWVKKARQSQVTVFTYNAQGQMQQGQGVYINNDGRVATSYDILKGAVRATVTDANGREFPVQTIQGASSMYNIAVLNTTARKTPVLPVSTSQPTAEQQVYILPSTRADANAVAMTNKISGVQNFLTIYNYSALADEIADRQLFCPVLNADGQMLGLLQPAAGKPTNGYVIDIRYANTLETSVLSISNNDLRSISIRKALPASEDDALSYIYLSNTRDTVQYLAMLEDFIQAFPNNINGYTLKAEALCGKGDYQQAQQIYSQALAVKSAPLDQVHYSMSKMMYQLNMSPSRKNFETWTLESALEHSEQAFQLNPLPLYTSMQAFCLYSLKRYQEAEEKFLSLAQTNMRNAENFLYASQCRTMRGDSLPAIIALQDSALAMYSKPYPQQAAQILLVRAGNLANAGRTRAAIADYNDYEHLVGSDNLSDNFYYQRSQLESKCRMFSPALNDIERAIRINGGEPVYYAELAALNYRTSQLAEAEVAARKAIEMDEKFADAWRILGVILRQAGHQTEGNHALEHAVNLGDDVAKDILNK